MRKTKEKYQKVSEEHFCNIFFLFFAFLRIFLHHCLFSRVMPGDARKLAYFLCIRQFPRKTGVKKKNILKRGRSSVNNFTRLTSKRQTNKVEEIRGVGASKDSHRTLCGVTACASRSDSNNYIFAHYQLTNLGYSRILFYENKISPWEELAEFWQRGRENGLSFSQIAIWRIFPDFFFFFRPGMRSVIVGMGFTTLLEK